MNNNTIHRRRLRKPIREAITIVLIGTIGAALMVGLWIGSVIQESKKLCPVTAEEISEVADGKTED